MTKAVNPAFFTLYNKLHAKLSKARDDERRFVSISVDQLGEILDWAGTYQRMSHTTKEEQENMDIIKQGAELIKPAPGETVFHLRVSSERSHLHTNAAPGVNPHTMLNMAISALQSEKVDAEKCPVHKPT